MNNPFKAGDKVHWKNWSQVLGPTRDEYHGIVAEVQGAKCFVDWEKGGRGKRGVNYTCLKIGPPPE